MVIINKSDGLPTIIPIKANSEPQTGLKTKVHKGNVIRLVNKDKIFK